MVQDQRKVALHAVEISLFTIRACRVGPCSSYHEVLEVAAYSGVGRSAVGILGM